MLERLCKSLAIGEDLDLTSILYTNPTWYPKGLRPPTCPQGILSPPPLRVYDDRISSGSPSQDGYGLALHTEIIVFLTGGSFFCMSLHRDKNHLAVIFDVGGVLLDWNPRYLYKKFFNGDQAAMEQFLDEVNFAEWNMLQDAGRPFAQGVAILTAQFPQWAELIKAYHTQWEESIGGAFEGSVSILKDLHQAAYPLYVLSNFSIEKFRLIEAKYEFFRLFDDILLSAQVELVKPDPRIFYALLQQIDRQQTECLLIDDSKPNIETAAQLGFDTIHFQSSRHLRVELNRRGII